jgi:hypothetical protein
MGATGLYSLLCTYLVVWRPAPGSAIEIQRAEVSLRSRVHWKDIVSVKLSLSGRAAPFPQISSFSWVDRYSARTYNRGTCCSAALGQNSTLNRIEREYNSKKKGTTFKDMSECLYKARIRPVAQQSTLIQ